MVKGWTNDEFDMPGGLTIGGAIQSDAAGAFTISPTAGQVLQLDDSNVTVDGGVLTVSTFGRIVNKDMRLYPGWTENIDFSLTGQFLDVHSADGSDLSSTNPGYVCIPSRVPGSLILYTVTANQRILNSDMDTCLWGGDNNTAWSDSFHMYVYAVGNDAENSIAFCLGVLPHLKVAPAAANFGDPSSLVADEQYSLFSFDDITEANFEGNPCVALGCIDASRSAGNSNSFDAMVAGRHGIGLFDESTRMTYPTGQHGCNSGTYTIPNGGTAAVFVNNIVYYRLFRNGFIQMDYSLRSDGGPDGSGAVQARFGIPYFSTDEVEGIGGATTNFLIRAANGNYVSGMAVVSADTSNRFHLFFASDQNTRDYDWSDFSAGGRFIWGTFHYIVKPTA